MYRTEFPQVYKACFIATGSREAALDATQEAFKRAYARWRRLSRESWVGGWIMTTALNVCKRNARVWKREVPAGMVQAQSSKGRGSLDERLDLVAALQSLPFRQRQAAILFYLGDLPVSAIAEMMQLGEGTVKAHLSHARESIRRTLGASYGR